MDAQNSRDGSFGDSGRNDGGIDGGGTSSGGGGGGGGGGGISEFRRRYCPGALLLRHLKRGGEGGDGQGRGEALERCSSAAPAAPEWTTLHGGRSQCCWLLDGPMGLHLYSP